MKTLYLECNMGAAGDMLLAALLELHPNPTDFLAHLNAAGIPHVAISAEPSAKCGITGTHVRVTIHGHEESTHDHHHHGHHHHSHGSYQDITHRISHLNVSDSVKQNARSVYDLIAQAESHAHGVPVPQIHFHEVGELDALADIIGVCMLIEELAPNQILASPIHVGSGSVRCAHGTLPVPAPATAHILQGVPIYSTELQGELCTPTGAALLKHFASQFVPLPAMQVSAIGYGMGTKNFTSANCVRAFLGETSNTTDEVTELSCNLDDMTPEAIAFAQQFLLNAGALDVYTTPIGMKKGRQGVLFTCMCNHNDKDHMVRLLFKHTTTLGIRETVSRRYVLARSTHHVQTDYGTIAIKTASGYGTTKSKAEYEDIAAIARENDLSFAEVPMS